MKRNIIVVVASQNEAYRKYMSKRLSRMPSIGDVRICANCKEMLALLQSLDGNAEKIFLLADLKTKDSFNIYDLSQQLPKLPYERSRMFLVAMDNVVNSLSIIRVQLSEWIDAYALKPNRDEELQEFITNVFALAKINF